MTTLYSDYIRAYDAQEFDIANVNFLAMLVDETYTPQPDHTIDDVTGLIIAVPYVIEGRDMVTLGMSALMDNAKRDIKWQIENFPEMISEAYKDDREVFSRGKYIVMFNPELGVLCFSETIDN
jgi:hypothetical protein